MKKLVTVLGARPQFIKAAVLSRIIRERKELEEVIVHTGQHFDANMSSVFFKEMAIPEPKYHFGISGLGHAAMTGKMLEALEPVLLEERPDMVVVYGDTNSTLAGALAAKKLGIRLAHVEAGLRSFNLAMPEEINRILTDRISDLLFCPTDAARQNLIDEAFDRFPCRVVQSGDIMKDAVAYYREVSAKKSTVISDLGLRGRNFILVTIHRQENTDDPLRLARILQGLDQISEEYEVIFPVHPRTRKAIRDKKMECRCRTIDPVGYFDMMELLKYCSMVITDSGGLQKEAFFHRKPCLVAREETEWVELVESGYARIVGSSPDRILDAVREFSGCLPDFSRQLYGNDAGLKIYEEIRRML